MHNSCKCTWIKSTPKLFIFSSQDLEQIACRNQCYEVKLVLLRLLSVLLSRTKTGNKLAGEVSLYYKLNCYRCLKCDIRHKLHVYNYLHVHVYICVSFQSSSSFVSNATAAALISSGAIPFCLTILKNLLPFWKQYSVTEVRSGYILSSVKFYIIHIYIMWNWLKIILYVWKLC